MIRSRDARRVYDGWCEKIPCDAEVEKREVMFGTPRRSQPEQMSPNAVSNIAPTEIRITSMVPIDACGSKCIRGRESARGRDLQVDIERVHKHFEICAASIKGRQW